MGCLSCSQSKSEQIVEHLFTESQYLDHLFDLIKTRDQLGSLLNPKIVCGLKQYMQKLIWPSENKSSFIRSLEDYVRFSVSETYVYDGKKKNKTDWYKLDTFGKQFGRDIKQLINIVQSKNRLVLNALDFYPKVSEYQILLNNNQEQKKIITKLIRQNSQSFSQCLQYSYFYLSEILVRACRKLQSARTPVQQINQRLENMINFLNVDLIDTPETDAPDQVRFTYHLFRKEEYEKHPSRKFRDNRILFKTLDLTESKKDKQQVLEDEIMLLAEDSQKEYHFFQFFLYSICKFKGKGLKISLKIRTRDDQLNLQRIKQKILFRTPQKTQVLDYSSINQLLDEQKKRRKEKVKSKLETSSLVLLKISDLLRGKCFFQTISDINETMQKIEEAIEKKQKKDVDIEIVQIDNRLKSITNDLVVKIKIRKVVAEFQMVVSNQKHQSLNNQSYHKVYELNRSKTLTTISMLFSWHEKSTIKFVRFLSKVIAKRGKEISQKQSDLLKKIIQNVDVSEKIRRELNEAEPKKFITAIKSDIFTLLIMHKTLSIQMCQKLKKGEIFRTYEFIKELQGQEKSLQYFRKNQNREIESKVSSKIEKQDDQLEIIVLDRSKMPHSMILP